jgi:hypothetical protein
VKIISDILANIFGVLASRFGILESRSDVLASRSGVLESIFGVLESRTCKGKYKGEVEEEARRSGEGRDKEDAMNRPSEDINNKKTCEWNANVQPIKNNLQT